jgi:membrane protein required for colicin V production
MNWVDLVVLGMIAISGLLAFMRGLVREVLGLGAWVVAAIVASPYGVFPYIDPWVRKQINDTTVADAVAIGVVFIVVLIVLSMIAGALSNAVQGVGLGGLDRTLGLVFGVGRGALLLCVAYILAGLAVAVDQWPAPILEARSLPTVYRGADWLAAQLPPGYRPVVMPPPPGRPTSAAALLHANPVGRATGARPTREEEKRP